MIAIYLFLTQTPDSPASETDIDMTDAEQLLKEVTEKFEEYEERDHKESEVVEPIHHDSSLKVNNSFCMFKVIIVLLIFNKVASWIGLSTTNLKKKQVILVYHDRTVKRL